MSSRLLKNQRIALLRSYNLETNGDAIDVERIFFEAKQYGLPLPVFILAGLSWGRSSWLERMCRFARLLGFPTERFQQR